MKLVSPKHTLTGFIDVGAFKKLPNCTVFSLSIFPIDPIKSLNMAVSFPQQITDSVVQDSLVVANNNPTIRAAVDLKPPCNIKSKSADRDDSLTFSVSSDGRELFIKGHDLSRYDAQTFLATFYPTSTPPKFRIDVRGQATYGAFGHEFPASVHLMNVRTHKVTDITK